MPFDRNDARAAGRARLHHELKNPLAVILGRAQLMRRSIARLPTADQAPFLASVQVIEQEVHVLAARIDAVETVTYADEQGPG